MIKSLEGIKIGDMLLCTSTRSNAFKRNKLYKVSRKYKIYVDLIAENGEPRSATLGDWLNYFIIPKGKLIKYLYE